MAGIGFKVMSVAVLLTMVSLLKGSGDVPVGQLIFFRSFFAIIPIVVFLALRGELSAGIRTARPMAHFWRGLIGVCGMGFGFFAITKLPLPEAVAMSYAMPLVIVIFGAVFLKEDVRLYRWAAVGVGFVGVAVIAWPRLTVFTTPTGEISALAIGALASLTASFFAGFAALHVRNLVQTERSSTIALFFSIVCTIAALLTLPFGWVWPSPAQWATLVGAGVAGGIGQILQTEAFRRADVSVVAPFEYTSVILSLVIGYVVFSDVPTIETLVGGTIVVGAGLFIIWREHVRGVELRKAREAAPPPLG